MNPEKHPFTDTGLPELHALREEQVRDEIARRLRCICGNFSEHDFQELVSQMAERQLKGERKLVW
ncbi:MAG: hypothetical protein ABI408_04240 [Gemmatimonadaceae bacterium]